MPSPRFDQATFDNYCFDIICPGADVPTSITITTSETHKGIISTSERHKATTSSSE